jgi:hypothetical protein
MATNNIVIATLNFDFRDDDGDEKNGVLKLEAVGDDEGGSDKSYVMYIGNVELLDHQVLGGSYTGGGDYIKDVDDYITFSNSDETSLPYPPFGGVEFIPIGQQYAINEKTGTVKPTSFGEPNTFPDGRCTISGKGVAMYNVKYIAKGKLYQVVTSLPVVLVFAVGRVK